MPLIKNQSRPASFWTGLTNLKLGFKTIAKTFLAVIPNLFQNLSYCKDKYAFLKETKKTLTNLLSSCIDPETSSGWRCRMTMQDVCSESAGRVKCLFAYFCNAIRSHASLLATLKLCGRQAGIQRKLHRKICLSEALLCMTTFFYYFIKTKYYKWLSLWVFRG